MDEQLSQLATDIYQQLGLVGLAFALFLVVIGLIAFSAFRSVNLRQKLNLMEAENNLQFDKMFREQNERNQLVLDETRKLERKYADQLRIATEEVAGLREQNKAFRRDIESLKDQVAKMISDTASLRKDIRALSNENNKLKEENWDLKVQIKLLTNPPTQKEEITDGT